MNDHEEEALRDFVSGIGQVIKKANALSDAIARYDAWVAREKVLWAEAERTGDWGTYYDFIEVTKTR